MPSPHFEKLKKDIYFEWNAASSFDWPKIKKLFVDAYISSYQACDPTEFNYDENISHVEFVKKLDEHFEKLFEDEYQAILKQNLGQRRIHYLIARYQDQPIAFFCSEVNSKSGKMYLRWNTINPKFHHLGIGRAILDEIVKRFPETNGLELYTRRINQQGCAFYNGCGFESLNNIEFDEPNFTDSQKPPLLTQFINNWLKTDKLHAPLDEKVSNIEKFIAFRKPHISKM